MNQRILKEIDRLDSVSSGYTVGQRLAIVRGLKMFVDTTNKNRAVTLEQVLIHGDLKALTPEQRVNYLHSLCESTGLNPLTKPFEFINLGGKLVVYAKKDATDQLRAIHNVSIKITCREKVDDVFTVTAQATTPQGRCDESIGAVTVGNAKGDTLANLLMKAETKAKRRVTLSICGLGILDESEMETIPEVKIKQLDGGLHGKEDHEDYVIPFGKYKGQRFASIPQEELFSYGNYIKGKALAEGQNISNKDTLYLLGRIQELSDKVNDERWVPETLNEG